MSSVSREPLLDINIDDATSPSYSMSENAWIQSFNSIHLKKFTNEKWASNFWFVKWAYIKYELINKKCNESDFYDWYGWILSIFDR